MTPEALVVDYPSQFLFFFSFFIIPFFTVLFTVLPFSMCLALFTINLSKDTGSLVHMYISFQCKKISFHFFCKNAQCENKVSLKENKRSWRTHFNIPKWSKSSNKYEKVHNFLEPCWTSFNMNDYGQNMTFLPQTMRVNFV